MINNKTGGRIFDASELDRIKTLLDSQEKEFKGIDKESDNAIKDAFRYGIILVGSVLVLIFLKSFISKRK